MMRRTRLSHLLPLLSLAFLSALMHLGCGGDDRAGMEAAPAAERTVTVDTASLVTLSGTVLFQGRPPESEMIDVSGDPNCVHVEAGGKVPANDIIVKEGKLANVVIYVSKGLEGEVFPEETDTAVLDQKGCTYIPHVLAIRTGQPVLILNSDPTFHNVHADSKANESFNIGQPPGKSDVQRFNKPEGMFPVVCDVHNWMKTWVGVFDHPAFAVSDGAGAYSFRLPPGRYTITAWHERFGEQTKEFEVKADGAATLDFTYAGD